MIGNIGIIIGNQGESKIGEDTKNKKISFETNEPVQFILKWDEKEEFMQNEE